MEIAPDHGISARHVVVCSPFQHCTCRLSLGPEYLCRGSGVGDPAFCFAFYACIIMVATFWRDFPFQTPLSAFLPKVRPWAKEFAALFRVSLRRWLKRMAGQEGLVEAEDHFTDQLTFACVQDFRRWNDHPRPHWQKYCH